MSDLGRHGDDEVTDFVGDDQENDDRRRAKEIRVWAIVSGVVLLAAIALVVSFSVRGGADGPDPTAGVPPTASATADATVTPVPTASGTPSAPTEAPPATTPPDTVPSTEPTSPSTPVVPPTAGQQETTDVFTPRLVWEPSTSAIEGAAVMGAIVEQGGSCIIVAERDGETVESAAFAAQADAQSTVCGGLTLSSERLTPGEWAVHVHYESVDAVGASAATTVTVG